MTSPYFRFHDCAPCFCSFIPASGSMPATKAIRAAPSAGVNAKRESGVSGERFQSRKFAQNCGSPSSSLTEGAGRQWHTNRKCSDEIHSLLHAVAPCIHAGAKSALVCLQLPLLLRLRGLLLRGLLLLPL